MFFVEMGATWTAYIDCFVLGKIVNQDLQLPRLNLPLLVLIRYSAVF